MLGYSGNQALSQPVDQGVGLGSQVLDERQEIRDRESCSCTCLLLPQYPVSSHLFTCIPVYLSTPTEWSSL